MEAEESDKESIMLPPHQRKLFEALVETGTPIVFVLMSGSAMDLRYADEHASAVINAWYPGALGGKAIADILFGKTSPSGKLPVTFYSSDADLPDYCDYSMKGRTYRYIEKDPLYPFGFGLSYASIRYSDMKLGSSSIREGEGLSVEVSAVNSSSIASDDVVQIYVRSDSEFAVPNHSLKAFCRIHLEANETKTVRLDLSPDSFFDVNNDGEKIFDAKSFVISAGNGQPDERSKSLGVSSVSAVIKAE